MDRVARPDSDLIADFQAGRVDAFDLLVRRYEKPLFGFLLHLTGDDALANDLFQDTFMRAMERLDGYTETGRFKSWLFQIARNLAMDSLRRRQFERGIFRTPADGGADDDITNPFENGVSDDAMRPDAIAYTSELRTRLQAALAALPDDQREVFTLKTEGDLTFREIAEITSTSINTVTGRMRYATEKLRKHLGAFMEEEPI